jgi:O-antigen/teichoic acid export membrane protein
MQLLQVFIRLVEVPLFIGIWGAQQYGQWLIIASMTMLVTLCDLGYGRAARREMAMYSATGNEKKALCVFQNAVIWQLGCFALVSSLLAGVAMISRDEWSLFGIPSNRDIEFAIAFLVFQQIATLHCGLLTSGMVMRGMYATAELCMMLVYALGFLGVIVGLWLNGGFFIVAITSAVGTLIGVVVVRIALLKYVPILKYGWKQVDLSEGKKLLAPAVASTLFPLGDMVNTHGIRILIGVAAGPIAVVGFTTLRTLCRTALQPVLAVGRAVEPELSLAYAASNDALAQKLFLAASRLALWATGALIFFLVLLGPIFFYKWTGEKLDLNWPTYLTLLGSAIFSSTAGMAIAVPSSTNNHGTLALRYVLVQVIICILAGYWLVEAMGIFGAALSLLIGEVSVCVFALRSAIVKSNLNFCDWAHYVVRPPIREINQITSTVAKRFSQQTR